VWHSGRGLRQSAIKQASESIAGEAASKAKRCHLNAGRRSADFKAAARSKQSTAPHMSVGC
jgi:hypothetical protein